MRTWELTLPLGPGDGPVYRQIAEVVARDIARGRLLPGDRLSSTRALAEQLGVNRNTVVAAFEALRADGWIEGRGRGTFVARIPPSEREEVPAGRPEPGFDLDPGLPVWRPVPRTPNLRLLLGGVPDLRLLPHRELARAYGRALAGARGRRAMDYADPQGSARLRAALAQMLARTRGIAATPESIAVIRGSQQGLYLVARALVRPGDVVAVEAIGFPPAWHVLRLAGAELAPLPVDEHGLDIDALEELCGRRKVRAVVVTPHHQYPTTVTLSADRRRRLVALAERHRMLIVEDDYDFEFHYDGPPVLPLASSDPASVVVYVATMSKTLAPGLRMGYLAAHPAVVERIVGYRTLVDQQGDHLVEQAVAQLLEDGDVQRHTRRVRRIYQARRDALLDALRSRLPTLEVRPPSGGMALWARLPGVDSATWTRRALERDVAIQAGQRLRFDEGPSEHVRLGFASCTEAELVEAADRLVAALPDR